MPKFTIDNEGTQFRIARAVHTLLTQIEDCIELRPGLAETPDRVAKAYATWFSGYDVDIAGLFKTFEDGAENTNEMVIVRDIPVYSHCEHHMAPIIGRAVVGYVPNGRIVGLSKLSRVVDAFSRRLQVQERLTNQIADAIQEHLNPKAVCVYIDAKHMCMESRGVKQVCGSSTITKAFRGCTARAGLGGTDMGAYWRREFLEACK
ncbi:queuosine biosynthesis protein [Escherichia phage vB_EcoS_SA126VB]|uniref:GTP cyclohydrolase I FolE n=1 Tax=Escherichia coli TaxID=562 RepID=UPI001F3BE8A5|nr:GTP cyclohydrolase I FolE [Escherichia coli]UIU26757.1 queuosine biosynthesis protein [Escherichia phage vB_EcoS_SA126VB]